MDCSMLQMVKGVYDLTGYASTEAKYRKKFQNFLQLVWLKEKKKTIFRFYYVSSETHKYYVQSAILSIETVINSFPLF